MKKLLAIIAAMLAIINVAHAYDFESGGIYYNITSEDDKTVEVTYLEKENETPSYSGDIIIPETVTYSDTEYTVTSIGESAFYYCTKLTSINLPASLTLIVDGAFASCNCLQEISISEANENYTSIEGVVYDKNVSTLVCCPNGKSGVFTVPSSVTSIGGWAFYCCGSLTGIKLPSSLTSIGNGAFSGCSSLTSIELPSSVTSIGDYAFYGCSSLTSINLPASLTTIGYCAFVSCSSLTSIDLPSSLTTIGAYAFYGCSSLTSIDLPSSLTTIGYCAFSYCSSLTSIELSTSLSTIDAYAFYYCTKLTSIDLPTSLSVIGAGAFEGCYSLKTVICLNPEPPTLGSYVFASCPIESVFVPTEAISAYQVADGWKDLNIVDAAYKDLATEFEADGIYYHITSFADKTVEVTNNEEGYSGDISIPETVTYNDTEYTVTKIADSVFSFRWGITNIVIPATVTSIGSWAFEYCSSLVSITSLNPEPPTTGENTFNECPILAVFVPTDAIESYQAAEGWKEFYIADLANKEAELVTNFTVDGVNYDVISIKDKKVRVASGDYSGDFVVPETATYNDTEYTVTKIADSAFQWGGITNIVIPATVTSIGSWAFEYCSSLASITSLNPEPPTTGENTFNGCPILAVFVPTDAIESYQAAEGWKEFYIADLANKEAELVTNFTVDGINYDVISIKDKKVEVASSGYSGDFVVPETVTYNDTEYTVTKIADVAFQFRTITSIVIPTTVTSIGNGAFEYCRSLASITSLNPEPPTTGINTFNECPILAVFVPSDAVEAYQAAEGWKEFYIADIANKEAELVTNFTVEGVNYDVISIKDKKVEVASGGYSGDIIIPETVTYSDFEFSVTSIGDGAFSARTSLTSIELPSSVATIGDYAFGHCTSLTSIELPSSLTSIGYGAFASCGSLQEISVSEGNETFASIDGVLYDKNVSTLVCCPGGKSGEYAVPSSVTSIGDGAFLGASLTGVELPSSLTTIGSEAFVGCSSLTSIELPSSVTSIGYSTFADCRSLTRIKLSPSLTSIGAYIFAWCTSLTSIELPSSVTSIGDWAFQDCTSLKIVTSLNSEPPTLDREVFLDCPILAIYVPIDAIEAYQAAEGWKEYYIADVANKDLATEFEADGIYCHVTSFADKTVEISKNGAEYSGDIIIPNTVTNSNIEYSVTSIGNGAFLDCSSLTSIDLPESLSLIGYRVFVGCSSLTSIELPSLVKEIGDYAFAGCHSLKTVISLNPEPPMLGSEVFYECPIETVYVPAEAVEAYQSAEGWSEFNIVGMSNVGDEEVPVYVVSDIVEEEGTVQEAREEVSFNFVEYSEVATGQGTATLTREGSSEVVNLPAAEIAGEAAQARALRVVAADGKDYQVVQPLGDAATDAGNYTIHFPEGYFLLGTQKEDSPAFTMSFTVGDVLSGISSVMISSGDAEYYTLQGVKVQGKPAPGIYICRQGNKATKVVVK
jgi:hypothetical protein